MSLNKTLWTGNLMGREKYGERKEQLTIQSTPHQVSNMVVAVLWHGHVWLPMERAHRCLLMM